MEYNPARAALGLSERETSDVDLIGALDDATQQAEAKAEPESVPLANSPDAADITRALSICAPLFSAAIEEHFIDPDDLAESVDEMLTAIKDITAEVEATLSDANIIFSGSQALLLPLCVDMVAKLWKISGEAPAEIGQAIVKSILACTDIDSQSSRSIEDISASSSVICLLIQKGEFNHLDRHIPNVIHAVSATVKIAETALSAKYQATPELSASLEHSSAAMLKEIINYDHITYLSAMRRRSSNQGNSTKTVFDIGESIRRHAVVWRAFIEALTQSANGGRS